jgi:hypothetical protein
MLEDNFCSSSSKFKEVQSFEIIEIFERRFHGSEWDTWQPSLLRVKDSIYVFDSSDMVAKHILLTLT